MDEAVALREVEVKATGRDILIVGYTREVY
jgi:hypothetical protein